MTVSVPETSSGNMDAGLASQATDGLPPVSPGNVSPQTGLSREGSIQGPLNTLSSTPTGMKQKMKQQGRFQIYEPGAEPPAASMQTQPSLAATSTGLMGSAPPISVSAPLPNAASLALDTVTSSRPPAAVSAVFTPQVDALGALGRVSEDGSRRAAEGAGAGQADSVFDGAPGMEPQKKGRFLVMEQQSISKAASSVNLTEAAAAAVAAGPPPGLATKSRSEAGKEPVPMGKPPPAPTSAVAPPVTVVLPKLQELLEHAAAQQAALQRLMAAVLDAERGKQVPLLSRTASTKSLFAELGVPAGATVSVPVQGATGPSAAPSGGVTPVPSLGGGVVSVGSGPVRNTAGSGGGDSGEAGATSGGGAAGGDDLRGLVETLRARVDALEADNARLRARNTQLEGLFGGPGPSDLRNTRSDLGPAPSLGLVAPDAPNSTSPREALVRTATMPRVSEDDRML